MHRHHTLKTITGIAASLVVALNAVIATGSRSSERKDRTRFADSRTRAPQPRSTGKRKCARFPSPSCCANT